VIGVGVKHSTSDLLISNCDEFIFYDDLVRKEQPKRQPRKKPAKPAAACDSRLLRQSQITFYGRTAR
jgi:hypothetical protein